MDIYVCQVKLKGEGGKLAINQYQYKIPDNLTAGDDIVVLIDYVADCVADFQQRVGTHKQIIYSMAISIGFAVLQTSLNRGIIVALEHGFEFPNVIGCDAVDLFDKRFRAKGLAVKIVAIANGMLCLNKSVIFPLEINLYILSQTVYAHYWLMPTNILLHVLVLFIVQVPTVPIMIKCQISVNSKMNHKDMI